MADEAASTNAPAFDLFGYFTGQTRAVGMVRDRFGELRRRFVVEIDGQLIEPDRLRLREDFVYDDGEQQTRTWHIRKLDPQRYVGQADDVEGLANGTVSGPALNWAYRMQLPILGGQRSIRFDDWMYRIDQRHVLNQASLYWWGLRIADISISFEKTSINEPAEEPDEPSTL